jgi:hypothetical protein
MIITIALGVVLAIIIMNVCDSRSRKTGYVIPFVVWSVIGLLIWHFGIPAVLWILAGFVVLNIAVAVDEHLRETARARAEHAEGIASIEAALAKDKAEIQDQPWQFLDFWSSLNREHGAEVEFQTAMTAWKTAEAADREAAEWDAAERAYGEKIAARRQAERLEEWRDIEAIFGEMIYKEHWGLYLKIEQAKVSPRTK